MKAICLSGTVLFFCLASAYGQGKDSLTDLPVIPAAETVVAGTSYGFHAAPMPDGVVCKTKMKGAFYAIGQMNVKDNKITVNAVAAWYAAHLTGFKKAQGYTSPQKPSDGYRSETAFYNPDRTLVVLITGSSGKQEEDTVTYGIAYERYTPGIPEKTVVSLTQGKLACQ